MGKISEKTRINEGRGKGKYSKYKPWIKAREISSEGTSSTFADYKHGREIQTLSQGELYYYYLLRWNDEVDDIREQYPMDLQTTIDIANMYGIKHPSCGKLTLTTDFLVFMIDGTKKAYSIKSSKKELSKIEIKDRILLEKTYWARQNVEFKVLFKSDVNVILVQNIMDVTKCYYLSDVQTKEDMVRYKIANKELKVDMDKDYLCYKKLVPLLKGCDDDED